jgi:hypothetical protein
MIKTSLISTTIAVFLLNSPVMSQDTTGTVTGQFDGEELQWYVTYEDGHGQSDWTDMGMLASVNIFAQPTPDTVDATKGALLIGFQVFNIDSTPAVGSSSVTYMQGGYSGAFGSREDATVTVEEVSIDGDNLHVKGSFESEIYHSTDHLQTLDTDNPKSVSGQFDVNLSMLSE